MEVQLKKRASQSIGINFDSRCNARCLHCCVSSSPDATDFLSDGDVDDILADVLTHFEVHEVGFTGGEPLLRKTRILNLIKRVTDSGRTATIVTNGFWGVTPRAAQKIVTDLLEAGLRSLTVSYDDFHAPYIKPQRIKNVLDALQPTNMHVNLNMAVSRSNDSMDLIRELGDSALAVPITRFPVLPAGEGRNLDDSEFQRHETGPKDLRCPGYQIIYHNDGNVYPCCSPAIFDTQLTLGRVGDGDVEYFIKKVERNLLLSIIQREGLGWFITRLDNINLEGKRSFQSAVAPCEVCSRLFMDREIVNALRPQIESYAENLKRSLL